MNRSPTLFSNLLEFKKFYRTFIKLNSEKDDHEYLGYPFPGSTYVSIDENRIPNYFQLNELLDKPILIHNKYKIDWIFDFICNCFENNTQQQLAIFLFYKTLTTNQNISSNPQITVYVAKPRTSLFYLNKLHKIIMQRQVIFIKKFEENNPSSKSEWQPNS